MNWVKMVLAVAEILTRNAYRNSAFLLYANAVEEVLFQKEKLPMFDINNFYIKISERANLHLFDPRDRIKEQELWKEYYLLQRHPQKHKKVR
jgi:hypothetical protein